MINRFTEYAGFWRRFAATSLDLLWGGALMLFLLYLSYGDKYLEPLIGNLSDQSTALEELGEPAFLISNLLPALLILFFWLKYAATPGKLLFDCDIVDADTGARITPVQAVVRVFGYFIAAFPLGLGFFWIMWDKRKQGWHDKMARTVVVIHDEAMIPLPQLEKDSL